VRRGAALYVNEQPSFQSILSSSCTVIFCYDDFVATLGSIEVGGGNTHAGLLITIPHIVTPQQQTNPGFITL